MDMVVGHGTSANCYMASLCIVTSIDSALDLTIGVCVLTVTTMRVGAVELGVAGVGWVIYPNVDSLYGPGLVPVLPS